MRFSLEPGRDGERRGDQGAHWEYRYGRSGGGAGLTAFNRFVSDSLRLAESESALLPTVAYDPYRTFGGRSPQ